MNLFGYIKPFIDYIFKAVIAMFNILGNDPEFSTGEVFRRGNGIFHYPDGGA